MLRASVLLAATCLLGQVALATDQFVFSYTEETMVFNNRPHLGQSPNHSPMLGGPANPLATPPRTTTGSDDDKWLMVAEHTAFPQYKLRVRQPKLCDPTVKQYSGYLDVDSDKHFYFWFFESRDRPAEDPVLLWLNGGPGCSSMTGLLMELGPCRVNAKGDGVVNNPHSWNNHANLIFLDQPVNVGYSYGRGVFNTVSASEDVYAFLQLFFQQFNQYASLPFHVFGESYGGHYVPAIGSKIFRENRQLLDTSSLVGQFWKGKGVQVINLDSLGIGNGLVDELVQYKYYHKMACDSSYGSVLSESACRRMENAYPACAEKIEKCYRYENALSCVPASFTCNRGIIGPYQESGLNPYDVREPCESGGLCYPIIGAIEKYLNRPEVKAELGADVEKYQGCNMNVNMGFNLAGDWMKPYMRYLPELLESGIRILVYAGDADFICNWYGNKAWTIELSWAGQKQFAAAKDRAWTMSAGKSDNKNRSSRHHRSNNKRKPTEDLQVGEVRSHENFTFLRVFGAGHMVPYDQPESSADMIERWLSKRDF